MRLSPGLPEDWVLSLDPVEPGAEAALALLASQAGRARVLLTGRGLGWLEATAFPRLQVAAAEVTLCSGSARGRGLSAERTPSGARWSSLARWMQGLAGRPFGLLGP